VKKWKKSRQAAYKKRKPWVRFVEWARRRCKDKDPEGCNYFWYGAKGIECHLTAAQLEEIWHRDKAGELKRPSLDRINSMYDYVNWNVRFIEFSLNARMAWDRNVVNTQPEIEPEFV